MYILYEIMNTYKFIQRYINDKRYCGSFSIQVYILVLRKKEKKIHIIFFFIGKIPSILGPF